MKNIFSKEYKFLLDQLLSARKEAGMLQQEVADLLNKPQSFVSKYERSERRLDMVEFIAICKILDMDVQAIVKKVEDSLAKKHRAE